MAQAKMSSGGAAKQPSGTKAGKAARPGFQKRVAAKRRAALSGTSTNSAQGRKNASVRPMPEMTGGQLPTSWANNLGEGAIGYGGMRFLPDLMAKMPVYGGMPVANGHVDPTSTGLTGLGKGASGNLYTATLPSGQTITLNADLMAAILPALEASGWKGLPSGSGGYRSYATQAADYAADPTRFARPGYSDHQYGSAIDITKGPGRQQLFAILRQLGLNQHDGEKWHWALPGTNYTP